MTLERPNLAREYLESNEDLLAAADSWHGPIAFDTEFIRTRTFFPIPGDSQRFFKVEPSARILFARS